MGNANNYIANKIHNIQNNASIPVLKNKYNDWGLSVCTVRLSTVNAYFQSLTSLISYDLIVNLKHIYISF